MLGLIGDNGAGKSTLIKILTGFHQPDAGQLYLDGEAVTLRSVSDARQRGIETVYQDLALINDLPVYLNMALKRESTWRWLPLLDRRRMRREARERLGEMAIRLPVGRHRGGVPVRRAAPGDRRRPGGLLRRQGDPPRRATGGDGGQGEPRHPRPDPRAQATRRHVGDHDRPQLRPDRRRLRPGRSPCSTAASRTTARSALVAAGADRADRLGLPRAGNGAARATR